MGPFDIPSSQVGIQWLYKHMLYSVLASRHPTGLPLPDDYELSAELRRLQRAYVFPELQFLRIDEAICRERRSTLESLESGDEFRFLGYVTVKGSK